MSKEISAGAIIFRKESGTVLYLLLHYPSAAHRSNRDYWDFVKGHVEKGENELETVVREAKEEAGLADLIFIDGFFESMKYFFRFEKKLIFKVVTFRLASTKSETITLSGEHDDYIWLPYKDAYDRLSFDNAKSILKKADDFLGKTAKL